MVIQLRPQRKYDLIFIEDEPKLVDVSDLGEGFGYGTIKEMREAVYAGSMYTKLGPDVAMKKFDSLAKRLLTGKLTSADLVHHSTLYP